MKLKNLKGVIFDVHRTLVDDSGFPRDKIWRLLVQSGANVDMIRYYRLYDNLTKRFFNWSKIDRFITIREIHRRRLLEFYQQYNVIRDVEQDLNYLWRSMGECKIYPEVVNVFQKIQKKYITAVLSNADNDDPLINILLKKGFKFDSIVTSESVKAYKPRSIVFEKVLTEIRCHKDHVVLVGDSQISDILGAKNFGIKVIWMNRRNELLKENVPQPDYQISNLSQLFDIIEI